MLAQKDSMIKEASDTILQLSQDEQIRLRCEARADYLYWQKIEEEYKKELEENKKELEENYQKVLREKQQLADDIQKLENEKFLINRLNQMLLADNRIEDLTRSTCDAEFQKQLLHEYHLISEE